MIGLFGIIKNELSDKGLLIAKYREWKNTLYKNYEFKSYLNSVLPANILEPEDKRNTFYYLFIYFLQETNYVL